MSLATALSNLPTFGKGSFFKTEDLFQSSSTIFSNSKADPQEIIISCKARKRRVRGYLSEGVKLNGQSEWKEMFGGGILSLGGSTISAINSGLQSTNGTSIQQPWMNRKFWVSSKPFSFTFNVNFVAEESAKWDVYAPAQTLLSFLYPRDLGSSEDVKNWMQKMGFYDPAQTTTSGKKTALTALAESTKAFAIPGPSIAWSGTDDVKNGDAVTLVIGEMFAFGGVYLESCEVEYSPTMDYSGYPTWAKCQIKATAMDVNYCENDGNFIISQYANSQAALSDLIGALKETISDAVSGVANLAKASKNAIGFTKVE